MNRKLFVGNLPFSTEESTLQDLFAQAGPVESVRVMRDQATGRSRGFGFVEMASEDAARAAIEKFNETEVDGRRVAVNEARPPATAADVDLAAAVAATSAAGADRAEGTTAAAAIRAADRAASANLDGRSLTSGHRVIGESRIDSIR